MVPTDGKEGDQKTAPKAPASPVIGIVAFSPNGRAVMIIIKLQASERPFI